MMNAPAPQGPGLGLAEPSVKMIVDVVGRDDRRRSISLKLVSLLILVFSLFIFFFSFLLVTKMSLRTSLILSSIISIASSGVSKQRFRDSHHMAQPATMVLMLSSLRGFRLKPGGQCWSSSIGDRMGGGGEFEVGLDLDGDSTVAIDVGQRVSALAAEMAGEGEVGVGSRGFEVKDFLNADVEGESVVGEAYLVVPYVGWQF